MPGSEQVSLYHNSSCLGCYREKCFQDRSFWLKADQRLLVLWKKAAAGSQEPWSLRAEHLPAYLCPVLGKGTWHLLLCAVTPD